MRAFFIRGKNILFGISPMAYLEGGYTPPPLIWFLRGIYKIDTNTYTRIQIKSSAPNSFKATLSPLSATPNSATKETNYRVASRRPDLFFNMKIFFVWLENNVLILQSQSFLSWKYFLKQRFSIIVINKKVYST